jgi:hypothetical protein
MSAFLYKYVYNNTVLKAKENRQSKNDDRNKVKYVAV